MLPEQTGMELGPVMHSLPQSPQLSGSVAVFTQAPLHSIAGNTQAKSHVPSTHVGSALAGGIQTLSQSPQCEVLLIRSTQEPSQFVVVPSQASPHTPLEQNSPLAQAFGHEPQ